MTQKSPLLSTLFFVTLYLCSYLLSSCGSSKEIDRDYIYFRDGADTVLVKQHETIIQPNDLLSIQVFSRTLNQEQTAIFNVPTSSTNQAQGYQVSSNGTIEMPVLGSIKAAGLTKNQLQTLLADRLTDNVKNPTVIVRFLQFNVNVMGEVRSPGTQRFLVDRVTIIDAISAAGDLTDFGKRESVTVIREEANQRIYHTIDLRDRNLFESPVYILQPNDIVYVEPNKNKLKSLNVDPEKQRRANLFFTITGVVVSVATLIITTLR